MTIVMELQEVNSFCFGGVKEAIWELIVLGWRDLCMKKGWQGGRCLGIYGIGTPNIHNRQAYETWKECDVVTLWHHYYCNDTTGCAVLFLSTDAYPYPARHMAMISSLWLIRWLIRKNKLYGYGWSNAGNRYRTPWLWTTQPYRHSCSTEYYGVGQANPALLRPKNPLRLPTHTSTTNTRW